MTAATQTKPLHLRLPATSANLGPGFDAVGLAMALYLTMDATVAEVFHIDATGRNADLCANLENNLILTTYMDVLALRGILAPRLHLRLHNEIPLGMGCGSSASALLAGVLLANHFGNLNWTAQQILEEACGREGHPDRSSTGTCC
jgi:homoserine kinase